MKNLLKLSRPQTDIIASTASINLFLSGQGGGKTFAAGIVSYNHISTFKKSVGLIAANTHEQLNKSTLRRIMEVWKTLGLIEFNPKSGTGNYIINKIPPDNWNIEHHSFKSYENIISFKWGAVVFIGSLENYKAIDGIEIDWAVLDETKDTREEALKEVILGRLRGKEMPYNPLYIFTSPAKVDWLNEMFSLDKHMDEINRTIYQPNNYFKKIIGNKFVTISSTHHNQDNLPKHFIENQMQNLHSGLQDQLIWGNPFSKSGGEFYVGFDRYKHVKKIEYNPELPIHATYDFNVNPFLTCIICQINEKKIFVIHEICSERPDNNTIAASRKLKFWLKAKNHNAGLFIYGDASGKHQDTRNEHGYDDFKLIQKELAGFNPRLRIETKNPSVVARGNFINGILENELHGISILFDPNCVNMIADMTYLKQAPDGKKLKETARDKDTKQNYEKYGHASDSLDYLLISAFKEGFRQYNRGGDNVRWLPSETHLITASEREYEGKLLLSENSHRY